MKRFGLLHVRHAGPVHYLTEYTWPRCQTARSRRYGHHQDRRRSGAAIGPRPDLPKAATGIRGLDEITGGGLPRGRPTLICGGPGSGKTLLALTFLANGALFFDEPGVLMTFEENADEIGSDVASLGFNTQALVAANKLAIDYVRVERSEIEETGEYDLEGLFVRLDYAIRSVGAKRVVLDTIESLFAGLSNDAILRSELRRLFRWLKDQGVTAIVTGERGEAMLTRQGLEEYVSDAVILLDHRVHDQVSTRRLRVVKYRGSHHGTNEYPFRINRDGISVLPVSSMALQHRAPLDRVSSGIPALDEMLSGKGYYRGGTVLVSGTAGTGKEPGRALHRRGMPPRRAQPLLSLRRIARATDPEHALDWHRPRALGRGRAAAVPCRPALTIRTRNPPRDDASGRRRLQARRRRDRSRHQSDDGRDVRGTSRRCSRA